MRIGAKGLVWEGKSLARWTEGWKMQKFEWDILKDSRELEQGSKALKGRSRNIRDGNREV